MIGGVADCSRKIQEAHGAAVQLEQAQAHLFASACIVALLILSFPRDA